MNEVIKPQPPPTQLKTANTSLSSMLLATYVCLLIVAFFLVLDEDMWHWFLLPVLCSGIVIGTDALDWMRGRYNVFDPIGIIGLLGFHFFFLAPLLHVWWNYWLSYVAAPPDWRDWLGAMALLNLAGLLIYRYSRRIFFDYIQLRFKPRFWRIENRAYVVLTIGLVISGLTQMYVFEQYKGITGYIEAFRFQPASFAGLGAVFIISETFPTLALMLFVLVARQRQGLRNWPVLITTLVIFVLLQLLFGGLRGSRSNTIWAVFWAVGVIHFFIRPIPKLMIYAGAMFLVLFMYVYGFYKDVGLDAIKAFEGEIALTDLEQDTGRTFQAATLGDLGRSDVQAYILYKLAAPTNQFEYGLGRTYLAAPTSLIPATIWPQRPPSKVKEGTELFFGAGSFVPGVFQASNVYGLAGEAMMNFGPLSAPLSFILLALTVALVRHWLLSWRIDDARMFILPVLINLCFVAIVGDSDNVAFFALKYLAIPLAVIWLSSKRID